MRRLSLVLFALLPLAFACAAESTSAEPRRPWTLVYHLAYDGNLDRWTEDVVSRLARATDGRGPAIVVQADRRDAHGMTRWVLDGGPISRERWGSEAGADPRSIASLLELAEARAPAERYGVFLVGHGGARGDYGYDEHPEPGGPHWMDLGDAARAIASFDAESPGRVELLYLQQCGRAHLATLAEVGVGARVILAAQGNVGAPNAYYGAAIASLTARPDDDGLRLARTIIEAEVPTMFEDLVAYDGPLLANELDERFSRVRAVVDQPAGEEIPTAYANAGRRHVDVTPWLRTAYAEAALDPAPAEEFLRWLSLDAILIRRASPLVPRAASWTGMSLGVADQGESASPR